MQTLANTGLFITAHDAMHGLVAPGRPGVNRAVGRLCLWLFGGLSWPRLKEAHDEHHAHAATDEDPDYVPGAGAARWYLRFMGRYVTLPQLALMATIFELTAYGYGVPRGRLWLLWVLPLFLSTLQLFLVGTWLPHRTGSDGSAASDDAHRARSLDLPPWLSFLACFHFGYHHEHHRWPFVPWWRLPEVRKQGSVDAPSRDTHAL